MHEVASDPPARVGVAASPLAYQPAPAIEGDADRLTALADYAVLDTPAEAEFDGLTRLIARICDVPIALISLVDADRQWFKSAVGLDTCQTSREVSFCGHAIATGGAFVVPDTHDDARFAGNPLVVGEPGLRFYAGVVLQSPEGYALGTLCVLDRKPRVLDAHQLDALETLAAQVMATLELRRQLAQRVILSRELDAAVKTRDRLLAVVSHDLRSPLSTVVLTAQHFTRLATTEQQRTGAERLRRAALSMRGLVDDLLDYQSLHTGRLCQTCEDVPVAELLHDVRTAFDLHAAEADIAYDVGGDHDGLVWCDAQRISQALGNLVGNALKMTPPGGRVSVICATTPEEVRFEVHDTGPGFDRETHARLFEPFWRGQTPSARGAGLGLAITRSIAEGHLGTLTAKSRAGHGAVFTLALPRRPNAPPAL